MCVHTLAVSASDFRSMKIIDLNMTPSLHCFLSFLEVIRFFVFPQATSEYAEYISKRHAAFKSYRDATISKWSEKTRLASGKLNSKVHVMFLIPRKLKVFRINAVSSFVAILSLVCQWDSLDFLCEILPFTPFHGLLCMLALGDHDFLLLFHVSPRYM